MSYQKEPRSYHKGLNLIGHEQHITYQTDHQSCFYDIGDEVLSGAIFVVDVDYHHDHGNGFEELEEVDAE